MSHEWFKKVKYNFIFDDTKTTNLGILNIVCQESKHQNNIVILGNKMFDDLKSTVQHKGKFYFIYLALFVFCFIGHTTIWPHKTKTDNNH